MDAKGIRSGLNEVEDVLAVLDRAQMGTAFVSVEGALYEITEVTQMVQRDEATVVCPIIVAGRRL